MSFFDSIDNSDDDGDNVTHAISKPSNTSSFLTQLSKITHTTQSTLKTKENAAGFDDGELKEIEDFDMFDEHIGGHSHKLGTDAPPQGESSDDDSDSDVITIDEIMRASTATTSHAQPSDDSGIPTATMGDEPAPSTPANQQPSSSAIFGDFDSLVERMQSKSLVQPSTGVMESVQQEMDASLLASVEAHDDDGSDDLDESSVHIKSSTGPSGITANSQLGKTRKMVNALNDSALILQVLPLPTLNTELYIPQESTKALSNTHVRSLRVKDQVFIRLPDYTQDDDDGDDGVDTSADKTPPPATKTPADPSRETTSDQKDDDSSTSTQQTKKAISMASTYHVRTSQERLTLKSNVLKPIVKWEQCGFSLRILNALQKNKYLSPFPVQAHVLPLIMSGHDVLCCAKTGSGKTLAFVVPLIRYVLNNVSSNYHRYSYHLDVHTHRELHTAAQKTVAEENDEQKIYQFSTHPEPFLEDFKQHLVTEAQETHGSNYIAAVETGRGFVVVTRNARNPSGRFSVNGAISPHALIIVPTRELASQIEVEVKHFTSVLGLSAVACFGGQPLGDNVAAITRGVDIIIATPGRLIELLSANNGRVLNLFNVGFLVIDEADRMFDMGFEPQIQIILRNIRPDRQTMLFSATFPLSIERSAKTMMRKPIQVHISHNKASNRIVQAFMVDKEETKLSTLLTALNYWFECAFDLFLHQYYVKLFTEYGAQITPIYDEAQGVVISYRATYDQTDISGPFLDLLRSLPTLKHRGKVVIFVDKKEDADSLPLLLRKNGYPCICVHSSMEQEDRNENIRRFKEEGASEIWREHNNEFNTMDMAELVAQNKDAPLRHTGLLVSGSHDHSTTDVNTVNSECDILVTTSILSRGIDIPSLSLVVNYDLPTHYEDYIHRVGRTGRGGNAGYAVTLVNAAASDEVRVYDILNKMIKENHKVEQSPHDVPIPSKSTTSEQGSKNAADHTKGSKAKPSSDNKPKERDSRLENELPLCVPPHTGYVHLPRLMVSMYSSYQHKIDTNQVKFVRNRAYKNRGSGLDGDTHPQKRKRRAALMKQMAGEDASSDDDDEDMSDVLHPREASGRKQPTGPLDLSTSTKQLSSSEATPGAAPDSTVPATPTPAEAAPAAQPATYQSKIEAAKNRIKLLKAKELAVTKAQEAARKAAAMAQNPNTGGASVASTTSKPPAPATATVAPNSLVVADQQNYAVATTGVAPSPSFLYVSNDPTPAPKAGKEHDALLRLQQLNRKAQSTSNSNIIIGRLEVNHYASEARYKTLRKDHTNQLQNEYDVVIHIRGQYIDPSSAQSQLVAGAAPLYVHIEGKSKENVEKVRRILKQRLDLEDQAVKEKNNYSKYQVIG